MADARRTVAVVTGTRAEFGLLLPVIEAIEKHKRLRLKLIVAGAHLTTGTYKDITPKFAIDGRVRMQKRGRIGYVHDAEALGKGIAGFAKVFGAMNPDFVVVLGDRIEAFAAAAAGGIGHYRVAHIHGGDRAEGVADESIRHAITKLAHLHFPATSQSRRRLVKLGECESRIYQVGSPACDNLRDVIADGNGPRVIVMQHPVGGSDVQEKRWMGMTLRAVRGYDSLIMGPNTDPGAKGILSAIKSSKLKMLGHVPRGEWLSLLKGAGVLVGNSSAGLIEGAILKTPVVNIGNRQGGRERPGNVIDVSYDEAAISKAVKKALNPVAFNLSRLRHPYGRGDTGVKIAEILAKVDMETVGFAKKNTY